MELIKTLDEYIPEPVRAIDQPFLMPIEDIFSIEGRGTVCTGRIERGVIKVNEEVEVVGLGDTKKTVVTGIEMFNKSLDEGMAGDNAGILLRGLKKEDLSRGQVLVKPGSVHPHTEFETEVYVLTKEEGGRHTPFFQRIQTAILYENNRCDRRCDFGARRGNGYAGRHGEVYRQVGDTCRA